MDAAAAAPRVLEASVAEICLTSTKSIHSTRYPNFKVEIAHGQVGKVAGSSNFSLNMEKYLNEY